MPHTVRALASRINRDPFAPPTTQLDLMSLEFQDARGCKEWLKAIPLTNVGLAQRQMLEAVRTLNRDEFDPVERLTCMELFREKVAMVQSEQRARYSGKTIPLSSADMVIWDLSHTLVEEMEAGYRKCFQEATGGGAPTLTPHLPLIIQRTMRYIGLQMLFAGMIYRRFDSGLWMRLHLQWIEAETRQLTTAKVKDSVGALTGLSSVTHAYVAILLAQLARTHELSSRQIDFVDAILKRFAAKVEVRLDPVASKSGHVLAVDLFNNAGAATDAAATANDHVRFLDVSSLSKSLRGRAAKLQEGEAPANLDLPADWSAIETLAQLKRLHGLWCEGLELPPPSTIPSETAASVAFGFEAIHHVISGNPFEQPGRRRELTRQELNDIAMFGKVSEATMKALYGDNQVPGETWGVVAEGRGELRLLRPTASTQGVMIGKLACVRMGNMALLAVVRAMLQELDGSMLVTFGFLPGVPEALAVRSADLKNRPGSQFQQGFILPAVPALKSAETLFVPSGLAQPGRGVDVVRAGSAAKEVTLFEFVERGADFDRATFF